MFKTASIVPAALRPIAATSAEVRFERVAGRTVVTRLQAGNPLKLLVPRQNDLSAWVIAATYGGGLLAGDSISLNVECGKDSRGMIGTQSSTKVYCSPTGAVARQVITADVAPGALLAVLPDPVVCFATARYEQRQRFDLAADASLLLIDGYTAGRLARGERWAMHRYRSTTDVFVAGQRIVHDAMLLDDDAIDSPFRTGRFNCFASVIALGPMVTPAKALIGEIHSRKLQRQGDLLLTASPLRNGAILRVAGVNIEQVVQTVRSMLGFVGPLLGENPWSRKW